MRISQLKISTFRNLTAAQAEISAADGGQIVALVGPNGAGKTSVLEALSLLSPGRGLHKGKPEDMAQHGTKGWGVFVETHAGEAIGQQWQNGRRFLKIDGNIAENQGQLAETGNVLWFTPRMDRLFLDGAAVRRDFLDRLVFGLNPSHAELVAKYKYHLSARLKLLKSGNWDSDWLDVEEQRAAELGVQILQNRMHYLETLQPYLKDVSLQLTGATLKIFEEEDSVSALKGKFERSRERDAEVGATHTGAQKVDLSGVLHLKERDVPLSEASSGQHKRAVVEMILAHARFLFETRKTPPLVLIDEVVAHLDAKRRQEVLQTLVELGAQVWVTDTDAAPFEHLEPVVLIQVEEGKLSIVEST